MMAMILEGYGLPKFKKSKRSTRKRSSSNMKLATAARHCKGKKKGAFRACIKEQFRKAKGHKKTRRSRR